MNTKISRPALALLAVAGTMLGTATLAAQPSPGPCALLTAAQVSSALGVTVGAGAPIATTGCSWTAPDFMTTVSVMDASRWEEMKAPLPGITRTPVAALGDDAFFTVLGEKIGAGGMPILTVKRGGTAYVLKVYTRLRSVSEQMAIERRLAANLLAAL
jgi:hypothetical protein